MLVLWGTVPIEGLRLIAGRCSFGDDFLAIGTYQLPKEKVMLGTTAMIYASSVMCRSLGVELPYGVLAGDLGDGAGSRELYSYLADELPTIGAKVLAMHYILPIRNPFENFIKSLGKMKEKPVLIGDAGTMLIAKATQTCRIFDVFTPDPGEISFLADPEADHPAYVQHYFFEIDSSDVPKLAKQAYDLGNAPSILLIKGETDYIVKQGEIVGTVKEPLVPALEPIGGTGDTLTGIVASMIYAGFDPVQSCVLGAKVNRMAGFLTKPTPATMISEIIPQIPAAWDAVCRQEQIAPRQRVA